MQDPKDATLTLALTGTGLDVLGGVLAAGDEARVAREQERVARQNARLAIARGGFEQQRIFREASRVIGAQRTAYAGQGVALGEGVALEAQESTARAAAADALTARNNAMLEALGHRAKAEGYRYESRLSKRGRLTAASGKIVAGGVQYGMLANKLGVGDAPLGEG